MEKDIQNTQEINKISSPFQKAHTTVPALAIKKKSMSVISSSSRPQDQKAMDKAITTNTNMFGINASAQQRNGIYQKLKTSEYNLIQMI